MRDIDDPLVCSLAGVVKHKVTAVNELKDRLKEIKTYHENVVSWLAESPNHLQADRAAGGLLGVAYSLHDCATQSRKRDIIQRV